MSRVSSCVRQWRQSLFDPLKARIQLHKGKHARQSNAVNQKMEELLR
jgi:hypothetical protein